MHKTGPIYNPSKSKLLKNLETSTFRTQTLLSKRGTWRTKTIFCIFRVLFRFWQGVHFCENSSKNRQKNERELFKMTSFFKSLIISGQNVPPNRIKRLSMSGRLPSCNSKQIYDVKVIYTPFLRSKMKIVWKNMRDIRVSQFDYSLWTSPRARYLHKLNSFDFYCKPGT